MGPYLENVAVFKCPADKSRVTIGGRLHNRIRSVSMNGWLNAPREYFGIAWAGNQFRINTKLSDLVWPSPANTFVLLDEHPDGINDGYFAVAMTDSSGNTGSGTEWIIDYPASSHNGACGFNFADGHSEVRKWLNNTTRPPVTYKDGALRLSVASWRNVDVTWLRERTTGTK